MTVKETKLYADIVLLITYVVANIPQTTGVPIHEWASLFLIVPLMVHILLDWKWVVSVTRRMFGKLPGKVRVNHVLDVLIFILMTVAMMTGLLISESALPALGLNPPSDPFWSSMHDLSANLTMLFIGVHLAMHWGFIRTAFTGRHLRRAAKVARAYAGPVTIILVAAFAVGIAAWFAGETLWADGFRQAATVDSSSPPGGGEPEFGGLARMFLPSLKVMVIMGVGMLFSAVGFGLVRVLSRRKKKPEEPQS